TGRVNAIKVLARVLAKLSQNEPHFALSEIRGGSIRNAIPREAVAILAFNGDVKAIESTVENLAVVLKE
ncbi:peptidase dimerization domain-containing protein, partial [Rhizobium leguminosarum]